MVKGMERMDLTETFLHRELLVDGKLLRAYRDTVRVPDGGESIREWIDHPGASAVVPLFEDGTTLLLHQYRYPPRRMFIEIPAGKLDTEGEDPEAVAHRELEEETGWRAGTLIPLLSFYPCIGYSNEVIHLYLARDLEKGRMQTDGAEFVDPFRLPFTEAVAMVHQGKILDMKSMLGLLLAEAHLKANGAL